MDFESDSEPESERGTIFGLVLGFGMVLTGIFSYVFGFGLDFGSIFSLIFGFGWIIFVICLVILITDHHNPITESEKVSVKAQVNTFEDVTESNMPQNGQFLPENLDDTTPLRLSSKGGRAGRPKTNDLVGTKTNKMP